MKKITFALLVAALMFAACSKNEDDPQPKQEEAKTIKGNVELKFHPNNTFSEFGRLVVCLDGQPVDSLYDKHDTYVNKDIALDNDVTVSTYLAYDKTYQNQEECALSCDYKVFITCTDSNGYCIGESADIEDKLSMPGIGAGDIQAVLALIGDIFTKSWTLTKNGVVTK